MVYSEVKAIVIEEKISQNYKWEGWADSDL
jgi:hypothetical protein